MEPGAALSRLRPRRGRQDDGPALQAHPWAPCPLSDGKERCCDAGDWYESGGILLLGYEMYRRLVSKDLSTPGDKSPPPSHPHLHLHLFLLR